MEEVTSEAFRAIGILLGTGLVLLAHAAAKHFTEESGKSLYMSLLIGITVCAILGFINASNAGSPTCLDSESDNRGTVCNEYADDGYEPTAEERAGVFTFWFVLAIAPILLGIYSGYNARNVPDVK